MKYCMKCGKKMQDGDAFCGHCGYGAANVDPFGYDDPQARDVISVVAAQSGQPESQAVPESGSDAQKDAAADQAVSEPQSDKIGDADIQAGDVAQSDNAQASVEAEQNHDEQAPKPGVTDCAPQPKGFGKTARDMLKAKDGLFGYIVTLVCSVVVLFVALFAPIKVGDYMNVAEFGGVEIDSVRGDTVKASYAEIDQSLFYAFEALAYTNPTDKQKRKIESDLSAAMDAASVDFSVWAYSHSDATEIESAKKQLEIVNKHLSDVNILALNFVRAESESPRRAALAFLVSTLISALTSLALAVAALSYAIKVIIGLVRHKPCAIADKFFKTMFVLSGVNLLTAFALPGVAPSGSPFGLFVFMFVCCFLFAALRAAADGKGIIDISKRTFVAMFAFVAFVLLCCNAVTLTADHMSYLYIVYAKPDLGGVSCLVQTVSGGVNGNMLALLLLFVLLLSAAIAAFIGVYRAVCAFTADVNKSGIVACAVAAAVCAVAAIAIGFASGAIAAAFDNAFDTYRGIGEISVTGTVWTAAILFVAVAIYAVTFLKPNAGASTLLGGDA